MIYAKFARKIACIAQGGVPEEYVMDTRYQQQQQEVSDLLRIIARLGALKFFFVQQSTSKAGPILGCSEKLKNAKSNYGYSYFMAPWYIETEKTRFF